MLTLLAFFFFSTLAIWQQQHPGGERGVYAHYIAFQPLSAVPSPSPLSG